MNRKDTMKKEQKYWVNPTVEELECLIVWPKGSVGETTERKILLSLLSLCKEHGFGRITQLASEIEEIWRDPNKIKKYEFMKKIHMEQMGYLDAVKKEKGRS